MKLSKLVRGFFIGIVILLALQAAAAQPSGGDDDPIDPPLLIPPKDIDINCDANPDIKINPEGIIILLGKQAGRIVLAPASYECGSQQSTVQGDSSFFITQQTADDEFGTVFETFRIAKDGALAVELCVETDAAGDTEVRTKTATSDTTTSNGGDSSTVSLRSVTTTVGETSITSGTSDFYGTDGATITYEDGSVLVKADASQPELTAYTAPVTAKTADTETSLAAGTGTVTEYDTVVLSTTPDRPSTTPARRNEGTNTLSCTTILETSPQQQYTALLSAWSKGAVQKGPKQPFAIIKNHYVPTSTTLKAPNGNRNIYHNKDWSITVERCGLGQDCREKTIRYG